MELSPIVTAVEQASRLCQQVQERYLKHTDKLGEPVTIADYGSQALICRAIMQQFPDDGIIAEESGEQFMSLVDAEQRDIIANLIGAILDETVTQDDVKRWLDLGYGQQATRQWVIDPIDGTKGFINLRRYTIAVGILEAYVPVGGIMSCPGYPHREGDGLGYVFVAYGDRGYVKELYGERQYALGTSNRTIADEIRVMESVESAHVDHDSMHEVYDLAAITNPAIIGVDGQDKYGMIAFGDGELYLRIPPKPTYKQKVWDHAAGVAIVQAAGGKVTDFDGTPLDFGAGERLQNNQVILVTNGAIHDDMVKALKQLYAEA